MIRNLLADRFHITVHRETKEGPGYLLVVGNPYSPPRAEVRDAARERLVAQRPPQVVRATALLWLGLILSLVSIGWAYRRSPAPWPTMIGTVSIGVALSIVQIVGIWRGQNWARLMSVVIAALEIIVFPEGLARQPVLSIVLDSLTVVLELVVLFFVFTKPGALWFKYTREQRV
jgi:hypothetical protein